MKIIIATGNEGKMSEFRAAFRDFQIPVYSLKDLNIISNPAETGTTFLENAKIKAKALKNEEDRSPGATDFEDAIILSDDSGFEIDALNGEPGVYSSRYLGETTPQEEKNKKILELLKDVPREKRTCRFETVMYLIFPNGEEHFVSGILEGEVATEARGNQGFGYDPIFYLPFLDKTTAEISREEKNRHSHRGQAIEKAKKLISEYFEKNKSSRSDSN